MKFLMNRDFGGWGLHDDRFVEWCKKNAPEFIVEDEKNPGEYYFDYDITYDKEKDFWFRMHPKMIEYIESGANKGTSMCSVRVVKVPDDVHPSKYYVHNYDGMETLHENHGSW